jgi:hypothetical protein
MHARDVQKRKDKETKLFSPPPPPPPNKSIDKSEQPKTT